MPFNQKPQKFNAKINAVTIGSGDKTVTIGGEILSHFTHLMHQQKTQQKLVLKSLIWGLTNFLKA